MSGVHVRAPLAQRERRSGNRGFHPARAQLHSAKRTGRERSAQWGIRVQTAQPRDVGALAFVIGLFLILFVLTVVIPAAR